MVALPHAKICRAEECLNPAARGEYCWTHVKRNQRGQDDAPRGPSRSELLREAAIGMADADADDDAAFERADANLRKAAHTFAFHDIRERIKAGMARAATQGRRPGRPPTRDEREIAEVVSAVGSIRRAAALLQCGRATVQRALKRARGGELAGDANQLHGPDAETSQDGPGIAQDATGRDARYRT